MLRWAIIVLTLANLLYFGWTQGLFGDPSQDQREPERLQAQIQPDTLRLMNGPKVPRTGTETAPQTSAQPATPSASDAPPPPPAPVTPPEPVPPPPPAQPAPVATTQCWQAGVFNTAQAQKLQQALTGTGLPASAWRLDEVMLSGRWIIYMGRLNPDQMARKKSELRDIKVDFREVNITAGPGLALGTFSTEEAAEQGLQDLTRKGVRTARVEPERGETLSHVLRLPAATEAQKAEVDALGKALAGRKLVACE
ncbi:MAG: SPOR domain-containing protein [Burkholderiaceae bacterium]